ncbi:MAG: response regulator transcription factor [Burkholderiales bacterium]|nr:response regulator transcription factor [Burkholderiales bacterium]
MRTETDHAEGALTVLVVEDDRALAGQVFGVIDGLGWRHRHVDTVQAARELLSCEPVDLIYLDRMLANGEDGLDLLAWFRDLEGAPPGTLVASRLSSAADHVRGLDQGADDYIDKPFDMDELKARLRALARRVASVRVPQSVIVWGRLELRTESRVAMWAGQRLELMPLTFRLLATLAAHRGEWVSREALWRAVWPDQARVPPRDYVINVAIRRLREALATCEDGLLVETGGRLGYRLVISA